MGRKLLLNCSLLYGLLVEIFKHVALGASKGVTADDFISALYGLLVFSGYVIRHVERKLQQKLIHDHYKVILHSYITTDHIAENTVQVGNRL